MEGGGASGCGSDLAQLQAKVKILEKLVMKLINLTNPDLDDFDFKELLNEDTVSDQGDDDKGLSLLHYITTLLNLSDTPKSISTGQVAKKSTGGIRRKRKLAPEKLEAVEDVGELGQVKSEPLSSDYCEYFGGLSEDLLDFDCVFGPDDDNQEENHLNLDDNQTTELKKEVEDDDDDSDGSDSYFNFNMEYDSEYEPSSEDSDNANDEFYDSFNSASKRKSKRNEIFSAKTPPSSLPSPYISLGPKFTEQKLNSIGLSLKNFMKPKSNEVKEILPPKINGFRFHCDQEGCKFKTNAKNKFIIHQRVHSKEKPYLCAQCGKSFGRSYTLKCHMQLHTVERPVYKCDICSQEFRMQENLRAHINSKHKDRRRKCDICNIILASKMSLYQHKQRVHEGKFSKVCDLCGKVLGDPNTLKKHLEKHASDPNFKPPQITKKPIGKILPTDETIDLEKVYEVPPSFDCDREGCGRKFSNERLLNFHMRKFHMTDEEKKVTCEICNGIFKDRPTYISHMAQVHCNERKFGCSICGMRFKTSSHLRRHENGHSKPGWKPRSICKPKSYELNSSRNEEQLFPSHSNSTTGDSSNEQVLDYSGNQFNQFLPPFVANYETC